MHKTALGLFHFNPQYVQNSTLEIRRYCANAVLPFLLAVEQNPWFRPSIAICGQGLEQLHSANAYAMSLLKHLVGIGQIELISSMYAPTIWPAYPSEDLVTNIALNAEILDRYGMKAASLFCAQEFFFGPGVESISEAFEGLICKDDYLGFVLGGENVAPMYACRASTVLVGTSHILREIEATNTDLPLEYRSFLAKHSAPPPLSQIKEFTWADKVWKWYHCGSGHYLASPQNPYSRSRFNLDKRWMELVLSHLQGLSAKGFVFDHVSSLVTNRGAQSLCPLPPLIEGSANAEASRGMRRWMGVCSNPWEDDQALLAATWKSRNAVKHAGNRLGSSQSPSLWREQLNAEASDPLGWLPSWEEVRGGFLAADLSYLGAVDKLSSSECSQDLLALFSPSLGWPGRLEASPYVPLSVVGSSVTWSCSQITPTMQLLEVSFASEHHTNVGITFELPHGDVFYSPSCLENQCTLVITPPSTPKVYLPLVNGMIASQSGVSVIRLNASGFVAGLVDLASSTLSFTVEGSPSHRTYNWQFVLLCGCKELAVSTANRLNNV